MTATSPAPDMRQLGANAARIAWYTGLNWLAHRQAAELRWTRGDRRVRTWPEAAAASSLTGRVRCNVCGWRGRATSA